MYEDSVDAPYTFLSLEMKRFVSKILPTYEQIMDKLSIGQTPTSQNTAACLR